MEDAKTKKPEKVVENVEDVINDNKIVSVFLNHKSFDKPKKYSKEVAVRILKNQKLQKGFSRDYSISEVVRKGK